MNKREKFERSLHEILESSISEPSVSEQLRLALQRLHQNPSIFCGNPNGDFTYEDPILANALYFYLESENIPIVTAGDEKPIRKRRVLAWTVAGVKAFLNHDDASFQKLLQKIPAQPITLHKKEIRLAIVGDGGYKSDIQSNVLNKIKKRHKEEPFDFLIHLGDIYFAGGNSAVLKHFLGPFNEIGPDVLALLGNHELYMGGEPFSLVIDVLRQPGRYFSIENDDWCIACLDTSLPARSILRNEGELDSVQLAWLNDLIMNRSDKGMILMSHHYSVSGWGNVSPKLGSQLTSLLDKVFAWYWGHEHGCATYDKNDVGFYGACVGNGAFLGRWEKPKYNPLPDWFAEGRCGCVEEGPHFWQHGYLELQINPNEIIETYHLEDAVRVRRLECLK